MANEDDAYRAWVARQPCAMCGKAPPNQCHHMTGSGLALRAHDHRSMPLCGPHYEGGRPLQGCHRDLHSLSGRFQGWSREKLRQFQGAAIEECRARHAAWQESLCVERGCGEAGDETGESPEDVQPF